MSNTTEKFKINKHPQEWLSNFDERIWSKLSNKQKKKLCTRFGLYYKKHYVLKDLIKQIQLPILPFSFAVASMNKAKYWDKTLLFSNPHRELWIDKITYDTDKWGVKRIHDTSHGIYAHTKLSKKQQLHLEQVLKSSVSLNKQEKIKVLNATHTLSMFQLLELLKVFKEEVKKMNVQYLTDTPGIAKLRKRAEKEWSEIILNIKYHVSGDANPYLILDKKKNPVPYAIEHRIKQSVKGQNEAVKKIATLLYYQQRIFETHSVKKSLPFLPLDPVLISGSTGSGKSFLIETACSITGLPYMMVDASSLVSEGIRGYTVNDILKDLLRKTNYNRKEAEASIIIFDEVDKLLAHHDGESILFQLLRLIEGSDISIDKAYNENTEFRKIHTISTKNMLFIFSGSFQSLIENKSAQSGFIKESPVDKKPLNIDDIEKTSLPKELLGRINDIIILNELNKETYKEILLESKHSPIVKYQQMLAINNKDYSLSSQEIETIIEIALKSPYGARTLNKLVYQVFEKLLFEAPMP